MVRRGSFDDLKIWNAEARQERMARNPLSESVLFEWTEAVGSAEREARSKARRGSAPFVPVEQGARDARYWVPPKKRPALAVWHREA